MPGHFGQKKNRILTGSSPVTTQVPHAVGVALAGRLKKEDFITFVTLGEGSSNQGDFHEGANFAGVHKLPVVIMVEDSPSPQPFPPHSPPAPASVPISAASTSESFFAMENSDLFWEVQGTPPRASTSLAVEKSRRCSPPA